MKGNVINLPPVLAILVIVLGTFFAGFIGWAFAVSMAGIAMDTTFGETMLALRWPIALIASGVACWGLVALA